MGEYTVIAEASSDDYLTWQPIAPAEDVTYPGSFVELAEATLQKTVAKAPYRVRVWEGHGADTGTWPNDEVYVDG